MDTHEKGTCAFLVGQILGIAHRGESHAVRHDLEEIAVALAKISDIQHPAVLALAAKLEIRRRESDDS